MRIFTALELPAEIKSALATLQTELRATHADVSWAKLENFHLTLKFLGEVESQKISAITTVCEEVAAITPQFSLRLHDAGIFPNAKNPRVLWAGIDGELNLLKSLHKNLDEKLHALGFAKELCPFNPHLTLGRVNTLKNMPQAIAKLLMHQFPALNFQVQEIVVMQSQLHSQGSIYTPLARCQLHNANC